MSDGPEKTPCEKLVAEAQAALEAGDRAQAKEQAWKALDCQPDAEETTGLQQLLEALEGPSETLERGESEGVEAPHDECDTGAATTSIVEAPKRREATDGKPLSDDEAEAFEAFLERGGAAGLEAEIANESDAAEEAPTPTRRRDHDAMDPFDEEDLRRQRTARRAKLIFGSLAGCVVLATGWVVVGAVAETPPTRAECTGGVGRPPAIAMPSLGGSGGVTPRNVPMSEIDRVLAQQRIAEVSRAEQREGRNAESSRRGAGFVAGQQTAVASGAPVGGAEDSAKSVEHSERVGSMMPASGTDAAPVFAKPPTTSAAGAAGAPQQQGHRPRTKGRRASRPAREPTPSPKRRRVGGGRFYATDMTSQVKSVHVAKQTPQLRLPVGEEFDAVLDLGITSLRHGEVLARVEQTVTAGKVVVPRGAMLVGNSENDRKRIYVTFKEVVIDGKQRLRLRAIAIDGQMRGLVPIRREATLEERQSAEVAKGALDVVGEIAKKGVGSIAGRAIDGVTQEGKREQEVDRTVVLSVPAGRVIRVKVLP